MGHRHVFSPSYMLETDNDQRWNLIESPCAVVESGAAESSSLAYPANNMSIEGEQCSNPAPVSNAYSSLAHNVQNLHYQQDTSCPSDLPTVHENYGNIASSSNYNGQANNEDDNGRWQYKCKSPADTNRYNNSSTDNSNNNNSNNGSSSEICIPSDPWEETQNMHIFHTPCGYPNMKRGHEGESSVRNVRSRAAPNSLANHYYTTRRPMDVSSSGSMREWNPTHMSSSLQSRELNPFLVGGGNSSENGILTRSNHAQSTQEQSGRGTRSYYIQRSSNLQLGHSDEGLQLATESYFSPHVRPTIVWRSSDRNARARITIGRYQSLSEEANFHDRMVPEGLMIVDRSAFGSRNPFDHHQDMRLDIDDMSYEVSKVLPIIYSRLGVAIANTCQVRVGKLVYSNPNTAFLINRVEKVNPKSLIQTRLTHITWTRPSYSVYLSMPNEVAGLCTGQSTVKWVGGWNFNFYNF